MSTPGLASGIFASAYLHKELLSEHHLVGADVLIGAASDCGAVEIADEQREVFRLLIALALQCPDDGHSFLDLGHMSRFRPEEETKDMWPDLPSYDEKYWLDVARLGLSASVQKSGIIGAPDDFPATPLVLDGARLYLAKLYGDELEISRSIRARWEATDGSDGSTPRLFVLLGGPGTGKTSTIARRLVRYVIDRKGAELKVVMAAPTGKAALRMKDALKRSFQDFHAPGYKWPNGTPEFSPEASDEARRLLGFDEDDSSTTQIEALTVHSLLGFNPSHTQSRWKVGRESGGGLDCDLLIIDECSMLSLEMMAHLLRAVPAKAEMWFVGDPNQLASVGVGSILADIESAFSTKWPDSNPVELLPGTPLRLQKLTQQHRQQADSMVWRLVKGIRQSSEDEGAEFFWVLEEAHDEKSDEVVWIEPQKAVGAMRELLTRLESDAKKRCELAQGANAIQDMADALSTKANADATVPKVEFAQVLCVHRKGDYGVSGINGFLKSRLGAQAAELWYPGRPIMITRNDTRLKDRTKRLYNGDTGVVVRDGAALKLVLSEPAGRSAQAVTSLSAFELNYAMTIHKSQGSEYNEVVVVLPEESSRICTREMLYTGVSRAKKKVTIVGSREVLEHMLRTPVLRASGLADRI
jgi:exodeoxyribonuclease V alpha subunit